ncbi:unnamed protein product [Linum tenue]|uniref:Uncharacterized protein n=1 Tax=Linum tenue TaxID=586396 RepID=A0AAV0LZ71_9ROSI|nr:unnamed protein product [Linum tenue]
MCRQQREKLWLQCALPLDKQGAMKPADGGSTCTARHCSVATGDQLVVSPQCGDGRQREVCMSEIRVQHLASLIKYSPRWCPVPVCSGLNDKDDSGKDELLSLDYPSRANMKLYHHHQSRTSLNPILLPAPQDFHVMA